MSRPEDDYLTLQARFAAALSKHDQSTQALAQFVGEPSTVERRLGLYRGNVLSGRNKALQAAYPVLEKIVGEDFFTGMLRSYMREQPSSSGDLNEFGAGLPDFLRRFDDVAELPYVADVAQLEWRVHRAHYAADAAALDLATLAQTAPEHQAALAFEFRPACALIRSDYPIERIWAIHQERYKGEFDVEFGQGPYYALVHRPLWRVEVSAIDAALYDFFSALAQGEALGSALEKALLQDLNFDLGAALAGALEQKLFAACSIPEERK